ncbi:MAG TPA: urease accessory protein UreD [Bryobacteraceae bacterium]|nr:urease accessory protein UreD [Bryobacteraceae bacterium]
MPRHLEGRLHLAFDHLPLENRTTVAVRAQQPPLKVVRAFPLADGAALVHLHNLSGGILGGDSLHLRIEVGCGAQAQVTSTGATRLYRSRPGDGEANQTAAVAVAEDGLLEYLPDPLIPFAGSRYRQQTRIDLARGAGLFWWEIVAPGREARGECFSYEWLHLCFDLWAESRPLALERVRLTPALDPPASWARLGPYQYFASFYICRVGLPQARWGTLEEQLSEHAAALTRLPDVLWAVSVLPEHGLAVRALARRGRLILPGLTALWNAAKYELYGREAIPPRKVL